MLIFKHNLTELFSAILIVEEAGTYRLLSTKNDIYFLLRVKKKKYEFLKKLRIPLKEEIVFKVWNNLPSYPHTIITHLKNGNIKVSK